eukprot:CAMPEP_0114586968 /NCGR_PEP_ID=MMETSP0125-20121206/10052_1 /TAXON_ID=485358 ORGANISM="Aristerostoma sp., Strain ATCC 50986" /NCGR_SAMPLE_ID=MMETSP0125 /ASSEMBLY_ACC=CAM_ASM_000245 /LENGTH=154 /DNA_ID=CAMNT_0001782657 /DNA_START=45 /DNA_END=509 /DNA_ORIENTATION=+
MKAILFLLGVALLISSSSCQFYDAKEEMVSVKDIDCKVKIAETIPVLVALIESARSKNDTKIEKEAGDLWASLQKDYIACPDLFSPIFDPKNFNLSFETCQEVLNDFIAAEHRIIPLLASAVQSDFEEKFAVINHFVQRMPSLLMLCTKNILNV